MALSHALPLCFSLFACSTAHFHSSAPARTASSDCRSFRCAVGWQMDVNGAEPLHLASSLEAAFRNQATSFDAILARLPADSKFASLDRLTD